MLFNTPTCFSRKALADFLQRIYPDDSALAAAWKIPATFNTIQEGTWTAMGTSTPLSPAAQDDLANFSEVMRVFTAVVYVSLCLAYPAQDLLLAKREGIAYNV